VILTEGSTSPGPAVLGLRRKVRVLSTQNQIRPPAMYGMVIVRVVPGAPSRIAQLADRAEPFAEGLVG
jgi:hypothetical protein